MSVRSASSQGVSGGGGGSGTVTSVTAGDATIVIGGTATDPTVALNPLPAAEFIQDVMGVTVTDTATVDFTYNDPAGTITADVLNSPLLGGQNSAYHLARANHTGTQTASTVSDFTEAAQDAVGAALTDTGTVVWTYNDPANTISAVVPSGSLASGKLGGDITTAGKNILTAASVAAQRTVLGIDPVEWTTVVQPADVTNSTVTLADVTGMSFPVVSGGTYYFSFRMMHSSDASATGSRWSLTGPTFTRGMWRNFAGITAAAAFLNYSSSYGAPAAATVSTPPAPGSGNITEIEGFMQPTANGTIQVQFASEVAASTITAWAGSLLSWTRVA